MKIRILCVGKIKEPFYRRRLEEYDAQIRRRTAFEIVEVADERTAEGMSGAQLQRTLQAEGRRMERYLTRAPEELIVALCIEGTAYTTRQWNQRLAQQRRRLEPERITYLIGGSLGLADTVTAYAQERLSFSALTYPHQLMRVLLAEQIAENLDSYL